MKFSLPPHSLITFLTGRFSGMIHSSAINVRESNPGGEDGIRLVDSAGRCVASEKNRALNEVIHQPLFQHLLLCENLRISHHRYNLSIRNCTRLSDQPPNNFQSVWLIQTLRGRFFDPKRYQRWYQRWRKSYLFGEITVTGKIGRVPLTTELCVVYGLIAD